MIAGYAALRDIDFSREAGKDMMVSFRAGAQGALFREAAPTLVARRIGLAQTEDGKRFLLFRLHSHGGGRGDQRYILYDGDRCLAADKEVIEAFLQQRRRGHHGGLGRAQGRKSADGCSYTKATCMLLTLEEMEVLVGLGDGDLSLGVRRLSERERLESGIPEREKWQTRGEVSARHRVKVYLDAQSRERLTRGGCRLIDGVRQRLPRRGIEGVPQPALDAGDADHMPALIPEQQVAQIA